MGIITPTNSDTEEDDLPLRKKICRRYENERSTELARQLQSYTPPPEERETPPPRQVSVIMRLHKDGSCTPAPLTQSNTPHNIVKSLKFKLGGNRHTDRQTEDNRYTERQMQENKRYLDDVRQKEQVKEEVKKNIQVPLKAGLPPLAPKLVKPTHLIIKGATLIPAQLVFVQNHSLVPLAAQERRRVYECTEPGCNKNYFKSSHLKAHRYFHVLF